jgi:hypothetical protein
MRIRPAFHSLTVRRLALGTVVALAGCGDVQGPETAPILLAAIVSNPVATPASTAAAGMALSGAATSTVAYVSLPPGSIAISDLGPATIRNRRTGSAIDVVILDGGFDPVPVPAIAGDTLDLDVPVAGYAVPLAYSMIVPPRRPPVVVRTDPPPKKRDVPLNAMMLVVFSEPMDPDLLTRGGVQLLQNGTRVAGQLAFADDAHTTVTFTPGDRLEPETGYDLSVTEASRDLDGDPLADPVVADFTTMPGGRIAFVKDGSGIYVMNSDGSDVTQLSDSGSAPAWSPDGTKIAFSVGYSSGIYVMNGDGSGVTRLTTSGAAPTWAPDGARIAFADSGGIHVMNADGSGNTRITDGFAPAWSPTGDVIAFLKVETLGQGEPRITRIWVVSPDGSGVRRFSDLAGAPLAWSPNGAHLAMQTGYNLYLLNADGSSPQVLADFFWNGMSLSGWSPDGRYFVLVGPRSIPAPQPPSQIYLMSADGRSILRVTDDAGALSQPTWTTALGVGPAGAPR